MSDEYSFGFEDGYEPEEEPRRPAAATGGPGGLVGRDPDGVVTVAVGESATVVSVTLTRDWRRLIDPQALGSVVVTAVNTATMQAVARQVEQHPPTAAEPVSAPAAPTFDDSRITPDYAMRLMDTVSADVERFMRQVDDAVERPVAVQSRGGYVRGTAQGGQVIELVVDPDWIKGARTTGIEDELLDVLTALHRRSAPTDLAAGPQSPAIAELTMLLSDPNTLLRRVGLLP